MAAELWETLTIGNVRTGTGFFFAAGVWAAVFVLCWALAVVAFRTAGYGDLIHGERRGTWALKVAMLFHHCPVCILAIFAMFDDEVLSEAITCFGCAEVAPELLRAKDSVLIPSAAALLPMTIGYMIADVVLLRQWSLEKSSMVETLLMILHHFLSIISWPETVLWDFCARYVVVLISYELSSTFLTANWMLRTAGMKTHWAYKVSGTLFTVSFVMMRMFGALPQLLAFFFAPTWSADAQKLDGIPQWAFYWAAFLLIPHGLNLFWGVKVIKGFAGAMRADKGTKANHDINANLLGRAPTR